jgi:hypothetical protein
LALSNDTIIAFWVALVVELQASPNSYNSEIPKRIAFFAVISRLTTEEPKLGCLPY